MVELKIGTRGSALALAQSGQIKRLLEKKNPGTRFRLVVVKTFGDEYQGVELFRKTNVGVFTKEIEKRLLSGQIDIAVHSLKDLPTHLASGLVLGAVPKRESVRDVLISAKRWDLRTLPVGARVGTGSPRRKSQLSRLRPDLVITDLRGNLDTRVGKVLKEKKLDAVVLAEAGLRRLGRFRAYARPLSPAIFLPAVGQGALAIEVRRSDSKTAAIVARVHDKRAGIVTGAERDFLQALRGGCRVPVGVHGRLVGGRFFLKGRVCSVKNSGCLTAEVNAPLKRASQAAKRLARRLLRQGAAKYLRQARNEGEV